MIISFDGFKKKEEELKEYKNSILKLIDQFIEYEMTVGGDFSNHAYYNGLPSTITKYYKSTDFYKDGLKDRQFVLNFLYRNNYGSIFNDEIEFTYKDHKNLLEFMKDPEAYKLNKKTKNYNL